MQNKAALLRQLFHSKPLLRIVGAHDGLGAKLIEKNGFDGLWASGLEISTAHAVPDANILTMTDCLDAAHAMNEASSLPVIADCDTGYGNASNVRYMVKKYEAAGIAAVVIEDKLFPKVNSFIPGRQELASVEEFMGKIEAAKNAQLSPDFMVFARVEALIAGWGMEEALRRAYAYAEAGADGIVIHSKASTPDEIYEFTKLWKGSIPLVVIPTSFYSVKADELAAHGVRMVIYANQGLRASMSAMDQVFKTIHDTGSSAAVEKNIASMAQVFEIQGMSGLKDDEKKYMKRDLVQSVILAAGDHRRQSDLDGLLSDKPLCMLDIGGKTLIDRQTESLRSCGIGEIFVVGGYRAENIKTDGASLIENTQYETTGTAFSFMSAKDRVDGKCLMVYSDILFDRNIVERLLTSPHPVTIVMDRAYRSLPFRGKKLDFVVAEDVSKSVERHLESGLFRRVSKIGRLVDKNEANYEFIGMAFFRGRGLADLKQAWRDAQTEFKGKKFYEAESVERADFNDLLQYLIDRSCPVHGLEIEHGWSEIHSLSDHQRVNSYFEEQAKSFSKE